MYNHYIYNNIPQSINLAREVMQSYMGQRFWQMQVNEIYTSQRSSSEATKNDIDK